MNWAVPRVERFRDENATAWDRFVDVHPQSTVYHTTWWQDIVASAFEHPRYSLVAHEQHGNICGILPLFRVRGRLVSSPLRDRGGVLGDAPACRALAAAARELGLRSRCSYALIKQGEPSTELECEKYRRLDHWITSILDLPADRNRVKAPARRNVRTGERSGLQFEVNSSVEAADRFFSLFRETRRRLGTPTYSRPFFRLLSGQPSRARFCLVSREGVDLAGIVLLLHGERVVYGYAGNSETGRPFRASDFAAWRAILWASESGYRSFDFGADSPNQTTLHQFKQKWGAIEAPVPHYYYLNRSTRIPVRDSSTGLWRLARRPWSWIPSPLFDVLSDWAIRRVD
jgi:serine/alanine adding enzyme